MIRRSVPILTALILVVAACGGSGASTGVASPTSLSSSGTSAGQSTAPTSAVATASAGPAANLSGDLVVASLGGSYQDAQSKAFMKPFAALTGVTVKETAAEGVAKLKAMVESGNVEWDVVDLGPQELQLATKEGLLEPIDWSLMERTQFYDGSTTDYGVGTIYSTGVLTWNTNAIKGAGPANFADFWDLKKFPGKRALAAYGPDFNLEWALLADGVPIDKLYPLDVDRAFKKLDEIKANTLFYDTNEQAMQLITSGQAAVGVAPNGRVFNAIKAGQPIAYTWNQGGLFVDYWAVPKGAKNKVNAMQFIKFASTPEAQAAMSKLIPYGGTNKNTAALLDADTLKNLPTAPEVFKLQYLPDDAWWAQNIKSVTERWQAWLLK